MKSEYAIDLDVFCEPFLHMGNGERMSLYQLRLTYLYLWMLADGGVSYEKACENIRFRKKGSKLINNAIFLGYIVRSEKKPDRLLQGEYPGLTKTSNKPSWKISRDMYMKCFSLLGVKNRAMMSHLIYTFASINWVNKYSNIICYNQDSPLMDDMYPMKIIDFAATIHKNRRNTEKYLREVKFFDIFATGEPIYTVAEAKYKTGKTTFLMNPYLIHHDLINPEVYTWPWEEGLSGFRIPDFSNEEEYREAIRKAEEASKKEDKLLEESRQRKTHERILEVSTTGKIPKF